jgi:hypothetical protein
MKFHPYNHRYPTPQTGKLEDVLDAGKANMTVNGFYGFPVSCMPGCGTTTNPLLQGFHRLTTLPPARTNDMPISLCAGGHCVLAACDPWRHC